MQTLDEKIIATNQKLEQLKRQKRAQDARKKQQQRKEETRQKIVIGGIVLKYFPQLQNYKPQKNNMENDVEFSKLAAFCSVLAADKETFERISENADVKLAVQTIPDYQR